MSYNLVNSTTGDLTRVAGGTLYADNPIGSIIPFGSSTIPTGYLLCNGQAVSRTTYSELFSAIGTAFGEGDGSTTFNVPDLREATTKGAGLSGKSNNHYDADGVALGEFVEDRVQAHTHANKTGSSTAGSEDWVMFATSQVLSGTAQTDYGVLGRFGATTEVKAVGVNYIIKAKHIGIPSDFIDAVDDAIADTTVDTVADGNMNPVTSNAVYDALQVRVPSSVAENVNLNTLNTVGVFACHCTVASDYGTYNYPVEMWGTLLVLKTTDNGIQQVFYPDSEDCFYVRRYFTTWNSWVKYVPNGTTETGILLNDSTGVVNYSRNGKIVILYIYVSQSCLDLRVSLPFTLLMREGLKSPLTWGFNMDPTGEAYVITGGRDINISSSGQCSGQIIAMIE